MSTLKLTYYIILILISTACRNENDRITEKEMYSFINEVLSDLSSDYKQCDAISDKPLMTIDGTGFLLPGDKYDSSKTLREFAEYGIIDSSDVDFILKQVDSTFRLEQNKINKRLLRQKLLDSVFKLKDEVGYDVLLDSFGVKCHGYISKPFFTRDRNIVLISVEWLKGYQYGQGLIIVFKKEDSVWKEEQVIGTWES